ncbi:hypothetical protein EXS71_01105 [Candidatus Uhrbacteria bacterium]|nr:hypothetical protein [Candidatus Uhrbacteria bacterium]
MRKIWDKVPKEIQWILLLFIISRVILTCIGVGSQILLDPYHGQEDVWNYSSHRALDIWGVWDTGWYLQIAKHGYSAELGKSWGIVGQANYAFFPLYPMLMRGVGWLIGDPFIAGIILSNLFLLLACWFLYKLVHVDQDEETASRAVKYLILFPTAFIFSGVFTESLFVFLLIACFYFAKRQRWWLVGLFGFFLALTRSLGVLAILPLLIVYLQSITWQIKKIYLNVLWLLLIPAGLGFFIYYNYRLTGDALAFAHIQTAWGRTLVNPFTLLMHNLLSGDIVALFSANFSLLTILFLTVFYRKIGFAYWLLGMYSIFVPLSTGLQSMPRYVLIIFPLFILLAKLTQRPRVDQLVTIALTLIQGFLMVFWSNGFTLII